MKKAILLILTLSFLVSCKKNNKDVNTTITTTVKKIEEKKQELDKKSNDIFLCTINDKKWVYTKASGIIDKNPKTGKLTAIFTFKKKLEKGSESVQLYYDAESFELEAAALQLKVKKKDGKLGTGFYKINKDSRKIYPQTQLSGSIDLSNKTNASGTAVIEKITMSKYEKKELQNKDDAEVTITDIKFNKIGYSDLDKVFKSLGN